jgi:pimeloyl-ACP methyl ester carboxylesterase
MRVLLAAVFITFAASILTSAQALNPEIIFGRDYTFERMEARRKVHDAEDHGAIRLVAYVYRPLKNDRKEVVLFSHGSTAGLIRSPKEALDGPPRSVITFFVSRGYTLVAPMRRGRAESSGTYVEECAVYLGECTLAQQVELTERSLREALSDTNAVIDQIILGRLVPRNSKLLAAGISRGGFLSLMLAGERPQTVKAIISFAGGWHSVTAKYPPADNKLRLDVQTVRLAQAGKLTTAPAIFIYAARDPFYDSNITREFFRFWQEAGGKGEYVYIPEHSLANGHLVATEERLWQRQVDEFLKTLGP